MLGELSVGIWGKYTPPPEVYGQHKLDPMGIKFFVKKCFSI